MNRTSHRKRLRRYEIPAQPRFLTCSCFARLQLFDNDATKADFVEALSAARERLGFRLHAWVIMPEHVHLVVTPAGDQSVSTVLGAVKQRTSNRVLRRLRASHDPRLNGLRGAGGKTRFWLPGGGFDRNLRSITQLQNAIRYVDENPVRRGLVERPRDWPWSSARWHEGRRCDSMLPIDPTPPL